MIRTEITAAPLRPEVELPAFMESRGAEIGAIASFVGYCRASSAHRAVEHLEIDHYRGFTDAEVSRIANQVARRHRLSALLVIHRVGIIAAREPIVLAAAQSRHRAEAFSAVAEMTDYLKTDAPFWKREHYRAGAPQWVEPTEVDRERRRRWS